MNISDADVAFAKELFSGLGDISSRKMMGGLSIYCDGTIFSIVNSDGSIWLKGAGEFQKTLEDEGLERWSYTKDTGKTVSMPYWSLPGEALDDPQLACDWARRALAHL